MKIIRTVALKMAILIMIMVATIGSWEVFKAKVNLVPQVSAQSLSLDHLTCYMIVRKDNNPLDRAHELVVDNQFGDGQDVTTNSSRYLCVPTTKVSLDGQPVPQPDPAVNLPHFKCYLATTRTPLPPLGVQLTDEFMTQEYTLQNSPANLFCNPVDKTLLPLPTGP